jgi:hypothetical protein
MNNILLWVSVAAFGLLSGCASPGGSQLSAEDSQKLKTSKVATSYFMVTKRVNYIETLYRVVFLETKTASLDISGIWQPDDDLGTLVNDNLRAMAIDARKLGAVVSDRSIIDAYQRDLRAEYLKNAASEHPSIPGTKLPPSMPFFQEFPSSASFAALSETLKKAGVRYLFEYTSSDLYGNAAGYGMVIVLAQSHVRLLDLEARRIVWVAPFHTSEVYQLGGDLKKLEENNLEKLKEGVVTGINKAMDKQKLAPIMGL